MSIKETIQWMLPYAFWVLNGVGVLIMSWDKHCAIKKRTRISEKTLLGITIIGGALGILCGMVLFHHKLSKPKFYLTVPIVCLLYFLGFTILLQYRG